MSALPALLQQSFAVSTADIEKATSFQRKYGGQLEQILVSMGSLSSETLPEIYARLLSLPMLSDPQLDNWQLPPQAQTLPVELLAEKGWLPFAFDQHTWHFATTAPLNKDAQEIVVSLGLSCSLSIVTNEQFNKLAALAKQVEDSSNSGELTSVEESRLRELASEAPTVNLL